MANLQNVKFYLIRTKWRIQYGGSICKNLLHSGEDGYSEVFKVADYGSSLNILKFKMADQYMQKFAWLGFFEVVLSLFIE